MKFRNRFALILAVVLIAGCLSGCDTQNKTEPEAQSTGSTEPGSEIWASGQLPDTAIEYIHCGLSITLDKNFITTVSGSYNEIFRFCNGPIDGGIEFGTTPLRFDGSAITSSGDFAFYLKETLGDDYSIWIHHIQNGVFYFAEVHGTHYRFVRGVYISNHRAWNVWLRCKSSNNLTEQMIDIIKQTHLIHTAIPPLPSTPSGPTPTEPSTVVEFLGLRITVPVDKIHEEGGTSLRKFSGTHILGQIRRWSTYSMPQNVDTIQEMAAYVTQLPASSWDHAEYSNEGDVEKLILYNNKHPGNEYLGTVRGYYKRGKFLWEVEAKGADCDTLVKLVSSGTVDDLPYYREVTYDIDEYSSLDGILQALKAAGFEKWGRYTLTISGLSTPVVLNMFGSQVESINCHGKVIEVADLSLSGKDGDLFYAAIGEYSGAIWLNVINGAIENSRIWVLSPSKKFEYSGERSCGVVLYPSSNGGILFRRYNIPLYHASLAPDFDPLQWAIDRSSICYEAGVADLWHGELQLNVNQTRSICDEYHLDILFAHAQEEGRYADYETLDELLEANLSRYLCSA